MSPLAYKGDRLSRFGRAGKLQDECKLTNATVNHYVTAIHNFYGFAAFKPVAAAMQRLRRRAVRQATRGTRRRKRVLDADATPRHPAWGVARRANQTARRND